MAEHVSPSSAAERLAAIGRRLFGRQWQSAMARALGVSDRQVRRWAAGDSAIPSGIWTDLARIEADQPGWPRDEWIIGTSPDGDHEYIVHARAPRFIGRLAVDDSEASIAGITYAFATGETLCEIAWIDPAPIDEPSLLRLMQEAETAVEVYTADSAFAGDGDDA